MKSRLVVLKIHSSAGSTVQVYLHPHTHTRGGAPTMGKILKYFDIETNPNEISRMQVAVAVAYTEL